MKGLCLIWTHYHRRLKMLLVYSILTFLLNLAWLSSIRSSKLSLSSLVWVLINSSRDKVGSLPGFWLAWEGVLFPILLVESCLGVVLPEDSAWGVSNVAGLSITDPSALACLAYSCRNLTKSLESRAARNSTRSLRFSRSGKKSRSTIFSTSWNIYKKTCDVMQFQYTLHKINLTFSSKRNK